VSERDVQVGAILAGKYRVERVLGQGGMGVVVEATQLDLDRRVALKFLRNAVLPETSVALTRFEREARTVARLRGAHIVQVYDVGKLEHGEPFIVMELLAGEDLSVLLDRELRLSVADAVDYILQSCEAMAEAHVAGVVHRDLKPANLFLTRGPDGRALVKVLDFGISKLMSTDTSQLSLTSGVLGSPLYMSPEQLRSAKDIDHRSDVWSLGTILYELVAGFPAFQADGLRRSARAS
jgi:serine/threonine-protein kinase